MATGIYFFERIRSIWAAQSTQCVDWLGIFDSNGFRNTTGGYAQSMQLGLAQQFGCWASDIRDSIGTGSWGSTRNNLGGAFNLTNASTAEPPKQFSRYNLPTAGEANGANDGASPWWESGASGTFGLANQACFGQFGGADTIIANATAAIRLRIRYGIFAAGSGSQAFRPCIRYGGSVLADFGSNISTIDSVNAGQLRTATISLAASGSRTNYTLNFEPRRFNSTDFVGPFYSPEWRYEYSAATTGTAYSTLLFQGGQCSWHAAKILIDSGITPLAERMRFACEGQVGTPTLIVHVIHGGNDRNYSSRASYDPATLLATGAASDTAAGYTNNHASIVRMCENAWASLGYSASRIGFVFGPYHPVDSTFETVTLPGYYSALRTWIANNPTKNACIVAGQELITSAAMTAGGEYNGGEAAHLSNTGYTNQASRMITALLAAQGETVTIGTSTPAAGTYGIGAVLTLAGTATNVSNVAVDISRDGGTTWTNIVATTAVSGGNWSTTWTISGAVSYSTVFRARDASRSDASGASVSKSGFALVTAPATTDVRLSTTYQGLTGAAAIPTAANVRSGTAVGATTGTLAVPSAANVRSGTAVDATTGTLVVPSAANVRSGTSVDATTGTLDLPAIGNVRSGTTYDGATKTGTLAVPAAANVRNGTSVDATTGTLVVPPSNAVSAGVVFDNGTVGTAVNTQAGVRDALNSLPRVAVAPPIAKDASDPLRLAIHAAGLTISTVKLRKFGESAFQAVTRDPTEIGSGKYDIAATTEDRDTAGSNFWEITTSDGVVSTFTEEVRESGETTIKQWLRDVLDEDTIPLIQSAIDQKRETVRRVGDKIYVTYFTPGRVPYLILFDGANAVTTSGLTDAYLHTDEDRPTFALNMTEAVEGSGIWTYAASDVAYGSYLPVAFSRVEADAPTVDDPVIDSESFVWIGGTGSGADNVVGSVTLANSTTAQPGVTIVVTNGSSFAAVGTTKSDGTTGFSLQDGTYTFTWSATGFIGGTRSVTVPGTPLVEMEVTPRPVLVIGSTPAVASALFDPTDKRDFVVTQHTAPVITFSLFGADGVKSDLTDHAFAFIAYGADGPSRTMTEVFRYTSGTGEITISEDDPTIGIIAFSKTNTALARSLQYVLRDTTSQTAPLKGKLSIEPAPE